MKHGLISLLLADTRQLRFVAGFASVVFAIGLAVATHHSGAYNMMRDYAPLPLWAVGFGVYGLIRLVSAVRRLPQWLEGVAMLLGMFLWTFTLVSFIQNPNRRFGVADWMLSTLLLIEVWVAASGYAENKKG